MCVVPLQELLLHKCLLCAQHDPSWAMLMNDERIKIKKTSTTTVCFSICLTGSTGEKQETIITKHSSTGLWSLIITKDARSNSQVSVLTCFQERNAKQNIWNQKPLEVIFFGYKYHNLLQKHAKYCRCSMICEETKTEESHIQRSIPAVASY